MFRSNVIFAFCASALCLEAACTQGPAAEPETPASNAASLSEDSPSTAEPPAPAPAETAAPTSEPKPNPKPKPDEPLPLKPGAGMGAVDKPATQPEPKSAAPATDQEAVKLIAESAQSCFSQAISKKLGVKAKGKGVIEVHVEGNGTVSEVSMTKSAGFGDEFDKCVVNAAKAQRFPTSPKSERVFSLPLEFAATD